MVCALLGHFNWMCLAQQCAAQAFTTSLDQIGRYLPILLIGSLSESMICSEPDP